MGNQARRILVADDERATALAIRQALLSAEPEREIREAHSVQEYREVIATWTPDLVLLKLRLPDGAADSLLVSPPDAGPFPIVVMADEGGPEAGIVPLELGALDFISLSAEGVAALPRTVARAWRFWQLLGQRKQERETLLEGSRQLGLVIEHSPAAIALLDRQLRYLAVSRRWLSDYRLGESEVVGRTHYEVFPEIPDQWKRIHERCLAGAVERNDGEPFPRGDGSVDWVAWEIQPWRRSSGEIGGLIIFSEVLTKHRVAQEALEETEHSLRSLFDLLPESVFLMTAEGLILAVNRTFAARLGTTVEGSVGRCVYELLPPEVAHRRRAWVQEAIATRSTVVREDERNGRSCIHSICPIPGATGEVERLIVFALDDTDGKRVEEELRQSKVRLETLFEHSPAAIWEEDFSEVKARVDALKASGVADLKGYLLDHPDELARCAAAVRIVRINQTSARLLGSRKEDIPRQLTSYFTAAALDVFAGELASLSAGESTWEGEMPIRLQTGEERTFGVSLAFLPGSEVTWSRAIVSFVDTTEQRLNEELNRLQIVLSSSLAGTDDLEEGLNFCLDAALAAGGLDCGGFYLLDERTGGLTLRLHRGLSPDFIAASSYYGPGHPHTRLVETGKPILGHHSALGLPSLPPAIASEGLRFLAVIPLCTQGRAIGCLNVASHTLDEISASRIQRLQIIGSEATQAILRLKAATALRESEEKHRSLLENSKDAVMLGTPDGAILSANAAACAMFGYTEAELCRLGRGPLIDKTDPRWPAALECRRSRAAFQGELFFVRRGGERFVGEASSTVFTRPDGELRSSVIIRDITERRQAERRLRQLSRAVEQSPASIIITDTSGAIEYVNPKFTQVTGFTMEEALGRNPRILKSDQMPAELYRELWGALTAGKEWRGELLNRRKNGELFWELASISPITDETGAVRNYVAVKEDVSEKRQAEEKLRRSEAELREAQRVARIGSWTFDVATREVRWSAELFHVFEIEPAQFAATHDAFLNCLHPEDRERVLRTNQEVLAGRDSFDIEYRVIAASGGVKHVREIGYARKDAAGRVIEIFGTAQDITESKQAQTALVASEKRFRTLVENAPIGIFVQVGGRFAYVNRAAMHMFGAPAQEGLIGQEITSRFHPESRRQVRDRMRLLNEGRTPVPLAEERCLRLDGTPFEAEVTAVPFDYDGKAGALVFFQELTERKRLEEQLRQTQKLEAVGQLAGGVAHDFNNILAATLMQLGLLKLKPSIDRDTRAALGDVEEEARRAASLTRQLLLFSRRAVLDVKPLDLDELVENLLKMLRRLLGEPVCLEFGRRNPLPLVAADAGMMEQVVMNLTVNARDAMPKGGRIRIGTTEVVFTDDELRGYSDRRAGRFVCLEVSDTGTGMDAETLKRIFEPFFSTKEVGKGTGLGLATVHGIVAQHRGWIEVDSALGRGTAFRVYLPAIERSAVVLPEADGTPPLPRGTETLLVVEDQVRVRQLVAVTLRRQGYTVQEAANGPEAIEVWKRQEGQVDLLLTDMIMPDGMTGLELADRLRAFKPALKVIISSGYSYEIAQKTAIDKAGIVYLAKPYEFPTLAQAVRRCLDSASESRSPGGPLP